MNKLIIRLLVILGLIGMLFPFIGIKMPLGFPFEIRGADIIKRAVSEIRRGDDKDAILQKIRKNLDLKDWSDVVKKIKKSLPDSRGRDESVSLKLKNFITNVTLWQVVFVPVLYFVAYFFLIVAFVTTDRYSLLLSSGISLYSIFITMAANMCLKNTVLSQGLIKEAIESLGQVHLYPGFAFALMAFPGFIAGMWIIVFSRKKAARV